MKLKAINLKNSVLDVKRMQRAIDNGLNAAALAAKADFGVVTQTWRRTPAFAIEKEPNARTVATEDQVFGFVDDGTKPHLIAPRNGKALRFGVPFSAKTVPGVIASRAGSTGGSVIIRRKPVRHPGTKARNFSQTIAQKWRDGQLRKAIQTAIGAEVAR